MNLRHLQSESYWGRIHPRASSLNINRTTPPCSLQARQAVSFKLSRSILRQSPPLTFPTPSFVLPRSTARRTRHGRHPSLAQRGRGPCNKRPAKSASRYDLSRFLGYVVLGSSQQDRTNVLGQYSLRLSRNTFISISTSTCRWFWSSVDSPLPGAISASTFGIWSSRI
jgi:hypothetical protein